jgi:hypothetical protein
MSVEEAVCRVPAVLIHRRDHQQRQRGAHFRVVLCDEVWKP